MSVTELKKYILKSKYARHNRQARRRETFEEAVNRVRAMMLFKFPQAAEEINWAYDEVLKETALGSQRALQYGGDPILRKHERLYNCTASYADRLRFFQEALFLLLCGCGVGFSVQKHHIANLPKFARKGPGETKPVKVFVVPDTIEGWSDALGVLLSSYFENPVFPEYYNCHVKFDFSLIRPEGSSLSSGAGKAPGPEPLRKALKKVRKLLERCLTNGQDKLKSIDVYDIVMHASDAVLAGGVRRSATICVFSPDDEEMVRAKTGDWFKENPQRARSNNSALLVRGQTTKEQFERLIQHVREWGEPGFVWADSTEFLVNPCQPAWAKVRTPDGIRTIGEIQEGDQIWSKEGWTTVKRKWSTGTNEVYRYSTTAGVFYGTAGHRVISNGMQIEARLAESIDIIPGYFNYGENVKYNPQIIMDGLVLGDGSVHHASGDLVYLHIGENDNYYKSEVVNLIGTYRPGLSQTAYEVTTNIHHLELPKTHYRRVPERYLRGTQSEVCSFLRGLFSANGSVCGGRVTLKTTSRGLVEDVQLMLSSIGIRSYFTTNKPTRVKFGNGEYTCRKSYDLNISAQCDRIAFYDRIGFIQDYKMEKLHRLIDSCTRAVKPKKTYDIISIRFNSVEETFDITVDNDSHTYWTQGCDVSNCVEIGFWPQLMLEQTAQTTREILKDYQGPIGMDGSVLGYKSFTLCGNKEEATDWNRNGLGNNTILVSGWQKCNLTTINGAKVETPEDFYKGCRVASIVGTLQAAYTDFPYLGRVTEEIVRKEALLGVSITRVMSNPHVLLDPAVLREGARIVLEVNEALAKKLGINPCARGTCMKPEGTGTLLLGGLDCGAHYWPFTKGIRNVQANRNEIVYQWLKLHNPQACEQSVWCANGSTDVISFPIEAPPNALTKQDKSAVDFLKVVKLIFDNWIVPGKRPDRCTQEWLNNSVSNTVAVRNEEWPEVTDFIYENRQSFAGVSLLPFTGDKDYRQAPHVAVYNPSEIRKNYFIDDEAYEEAERLLAQAEQLFDQDVFSACEVIANSSMLQYGEYTALTLQQYDWACHVWDFTQNHLGVDAIACKKMSYLLKDIWYFRKYSMLKDTFEPVNYELLIEEDDNTQPQQEIVCAGGACQI